MFRSLLAHPQEALYNGTWYIVYVLCQLTAPGIKQPGHGVDHPVPSSVEAKARVELLYTFRPCLHGLLQGGFVIMLSLLNCKLCFIV
jgi:hypothetical protein